MDQNAELIGLLKSIINYIPLSSVSCNGNKCRELWCESCFCEETVAEELDKAEALFKKTKSIIESHKV